MKPQTCLGWRRCHSETGVLHKPPVEGCAASLLLLQMVHVALLPHTGEQLGPE